jgi:antitoxin component YwqK of YwqJK toxin-antitoxin module
MKKKNLTFLILFLICIKPIHCQEINHVKKEQKIITKIRNKYLVETVYLIDSLVQLTYYDISKSDTTLVKKFAAKKNCDSLIYEGKSFGYSNNKLSEINNYVNGKKEGVELSYSIDKNFIEYSKEYKNDTIDGVYIRYYENGNIREVGKCYLLTNFKYGKWIYFYENGDVERIGEYGVININDEPIMSNVQTNDLHINNFRDYFTVKIGSWCFYGTDNSILKQHDFIHPEISFD